ncbi:hypothetical protein J0X20_14510 [Streptomyces sp. KCTC 0041BP]|uniref:hypothetical protein n=1 Tax=Streptomyces sp. KCTC 0041BP TaxID=201500 RepID=UPI001AE43C07|nr:hypothetical protein [Streptomyces sp. KCTC 0041BP]MBP0934809.1 hypothetical protein [Streptomyces sp. KCTC 0041BP]
MVAGRRIRFAAVLAFVVLALTGFSSSGGSGNGSGSGKSKSNSSSGGGCSSSKSGKPKKKSHGGSGGGSATASATPTGSPAAPPAHAEVVTCAGQGRTKATLKVTSDVTGARTFRVPLVFEGAAGPVDSATVEVALEARESRTVEVAMTLPARAADVRGCAVGRIDTVPAATPSPSGTSDGSDSGSGTGSGSGIGKPGSKPKPKSTSRPNPKRTR